MEYTPYRSRFWEWFAIGIPVGSLGGIRIRIHFLLLLALLYNWTFYADLALPGYVKTSLWLFSFFALFGSILLHEFGHCYGAFRVGGHADQIILWPLGGLAYASGTERGPRQELIVTILGPAVSLILAASFSAAWYLARLIPAPASASEAIQYTYWGLITGLKHLAFLNWMLFGFNMLMPLFPMDCARIIRSLASRRYNPNRVTYVLTTFGLGLGIFLALASFLHLFSDLVGPWVGLIGILGAFACYQERKRLEFGDVYDDGPWYWRGSSSYASYTPPERKSVFAVVKNASAANSGASADPKQRKLSEREKLQRELEQATQREDFERAAQLRDRIRNLLEQERAQRKP